MSKLSQATFPYLFINENQPYFEANFLSWILSFCIFPLIHLNILILSILFINTIEPSPTFVEVPFLFARKQCLRLIARTLQINRTLHFQSPTTNVCFSLTSHSLFPLSLLPWLMEEKKETLSCSLSWLLAISIPFMALARQLEWKEGYIVTIVNTTLKIQRLKSSLPSKTNIRLAEIPFQGTNYGLLPDVEKTDTLSHELVIRLMEASENLKSPFKSPSSLTFPNTTVMPPCVSS